MELKGALNVTFELYLMLHTLVHLLVHKSAQNDSMKDKLEDSFYVALEDPPKISL